MCLPLQMVALKSLHRLDQATLIFSLQFRNLCEYGIARGLHVSSGYRWTCWRFDRDFAVQKIEIDGLTIPDRSANMT